jgi:hypothetical protein
LLRDDVFVNIYDPDLEDILFYDIEEMIVNHIKKDSKYIFMRNFKNSKRQKYNSEIEYYMMLNSIVDFEIFRPVMELTHKNKNENMGRPIKDDILTFKLIFLKFIKNIPYTKINELTLESESMHFFLDYEDTGFLPKKSCLWDKIEALNEKKLYNEIWKISQDIIKSYFIFPSNVSGQDSTFFTQDPGHKKGSRPRGDKAKTRESVDGTWTVKNGKSYFGYKIYIEY